MSKKLITIISIVAAIILGVWIWTFAMIGHSPIIIGGSSSANPFMQNVTTKLKAVDYSYNSTGSQNGMNGVLNGNYKAGVLSKSVDTSDKKWDKEYNLQTDIDEKKFGSYFKEKISNPYLYTATKIATDAIVVIYHPPGKMPDDEELNFTLDPSNLLKKIYENTITDWSQIDSNLHGEIEPFTRETGSGTKTSFESLANIKNSTNANVVNSNGMMFSSVQSTVGAIGFVSLPFVRQIDKNDDVYVAGIDGFRIGYARDEESNMSYQLENGKWIVNKGGQDNDQAIKDNIYKLNRPFIIVYKNSSIKSLKTLFLFLIDSKSDTVYESEGLVKSFADYNTPPTESHKVTVWS